MELSFIESNHHTRIKVQTKLLPIYRKLIYSYTALHGGKETKRNSRFIYFEIYADLMNTRIEKAPIEVAIR